VKVKFNENIDVLLTKHASERSIERNGQPVNITKDQIENILNSAESKIIQLGKKFPTLIIKTKNALNIVGKLIQSGSDYFFQVIILMFKKNFVPNNLHDKVVYIKEYKQIQRKTILKSKNISSIKQIIERIEHQRVQKISNLDRFKEGTIVEKNGRKGKVIAISPKRTSIIVEWNDTKKKSRFFMNKRGKNRIIDELKLTSIIEKIQNE